jgi:hypothetical protein
VASPDSGKIPMSHVSQCAPSDEKGIPRVWGDLQLRAPRPNTQNRVRVVLAELGQI